MKQILTIGQTTLVLPASTNINTLVNALSGAKLVTKTYHDPGPNKRLEWFYHVEEAPEIEIKIVDDRQVLDPSKRKSIPQHTGGPY
jgi:hypothetical protein